MNSHYTIQQISASLWRGLKDGVTVEEFAGYGRSGDATCWMMRMNATGGRACKATRQAWIVEWFKKPSNFCADAVTQSFHEEYHTAFPGYARKQTCWGAEPVARAMDDLKEMVGDGILKSGVIGLRGNWQPGFPKWVISYTMK